MRSKAPAPGSSSQPSAVVLGRRMSPLDVTDDDFDVISDVDDFEVINDVDDVAAAVIKSLSWKLSVGGSLIGATSTSMSGLPLMTSGSASSSSSSSTSSAGSPSLPYVDSFRSIT